MILFEHTPSEVIRHPPRRKSPRGLSFPGEHSALTGAWDVTGQPEHRTKTSRSRASEHFGVYERAAQVRRGETCRFRRSRMRKAKTISARPTTMAKIPMNGARVGRSEPTRAARITPKSTDSAPPPASSRARRGRDLARREPRARIAGQRGRVAPRTASSRRTCLASTCRVLRCSCRPPHSRSIPRGRAYLAWRSSSSSGPPLLSPARLRGRSLFRPTAMPTVLVTKAAAKPQTTPITAPLRTPSVNHTTPRLTSKDTTTKTTTDKRTVAVILANICTAVATLMRRSIPSVLHTSLILLLRVTVVSLSRLLGISASIIPSGSVW
jgi:hypothetical protein